jgi:phenylacetate-CoA ligase
MHYIWKLRGYHQNDLKITLRGKNLGNKTIIYNPVHNEFVFNTYIKVITYKAEVLNLFRKRQIKYIHGYPSSIYVFLNELEQILSKSEIEVIKTNLKSCFFGSEFPSPYITEYITNKWGLDYISWYGHSEMCILAYDNNKTNEYTPFLSYGYPEVENNRLIGTSFHNFDMPLIRYDTGDLINPITVEKGILKKFQISEGRCGDFILDKKGKQISLTSLVFGRHHNAFDFVDFIQVKQSMDGHIIFFLTVNDDKFIGSKSCLDLSNVDIDFDIIIIPQPIRTKLGKVPLKIIE